MAITVDKQGLKKFVEKWTGRGKEDEDDRSYWIDLFQNVFGQSDVTDRIDFQKKVIGPDGNTKRIDAYIPETSVIIEQKSLGIALDKPQAGHNGMTPYEQAKMYDNGLPRSEKARWIVTSNFDEIWVFDMEKRKPEEEVIKINLKNLDKEYHMLQFLFDPQVEQIRHELKVSQEAGDRIGRVYDALLSLYPGEPTEDEYKSLNLFCVRLVFCYYAEDAGLFSKYQFRDYVASFNPKHLRNGLKDLFRILDTKEDERDRTEEPELLAFPYVNGGLFSDRNIIVPQIDEKTQSIMTETSDFNWSEISPTIFGAVFESTLNQETRRKGGMHYTSIENIHKVIDPLFLNDLKNEYKTINESKQPNVKRQKLQDFQNKLGTLKFLDPACGSGNFLTETYLSLRRLENEVIKNIIELDKSVFDKQIALGELGSANSVIKVTLSQFYGIEINDFAVAVSKAALWIAESQMLKETEAIVYHNISFLPLKSYVNIVEGNALRVDWELVIPREQCTYIMGNPPFIGASLQTAEQKEDLQLVCAEDNGKAYNAVGKMDYVAGWYFKAAMYVNGTTTRCAFVSTNSITQGEQVAYVWKPLYDRFGIHIDFAHKTFVWDSEANLKAHVHCVIIGFSCCNVEHVLLYDSDSCKEVHSISPYLIPGEIIFVESRSKSICRVPDMCKGFQATDNGYLTLNQDEYDELILKEPKSQRWIRPYSMGVEFINNIPRYCLWLKDITPHELRELPEIRKRVEDCKEWRYQSKKTGDAYNLRDVPHLFRPCKQFVDDVYIAIPLVSSSSRQYMPMAYVDNGMIPGNNLFCVFNATRYHFGVLMSKAHMLWIRSVGGYLKSDWRYSKDIVYNNFPWPNPTNEQIEKIEKTAQAILDSRLQYPDSSLADLYDPVTMPIELRKAHLLNDKAVMEAYGFEADMDDSDLIAELMNMYKELVNTTN